MRPGMASLRGTIGFEIASDFSDVSQEQSLGQRPLIGRRSENGGGMNRREHRLCPVGFDRSAARLHDAERATKERFRRRGAEANDDAWFYESDLVLEPRETRTDFPGVRRFVEAARAARIARPLEMLHGVGDVDVIAIDVRGVERTVEELA